METSTNKIINTINYLIWIQENRLEAYGQALDTDIDNHLTYNLFSEGCELSTSCRDQLCKSIMLFGSNNSNNTSSSSHVWMHLEAALVSKNQKLILSLFESGEKAIQRSYEYALKVNTVPGYIREMVSVQKQRLKDQLDQVIELKIQAQLKEPQLPKANHNLSRKHSGYTLFNNPASRAGAFR